MRGAPIKDLTGKRFGMLTVIEQAGHQGRLVMWHCKCDCGGERTVAGRYLREGKANSCGCKMIPHQNCDCYGRLHRIWKEMKKRCYNANGKDYPIYGGRGITVCEEWKDNFPAFREWAIAHGYNDELSIDRIDSNGNYEPDNCRWADNITQSNNRRTNVYVEIDGEMHTYAEWSRITGIDRAIIRGRYKAGKRGKELIKKP